MSADDIHNYLLDDCRQGLSTNGLSGVDEIVSRKKGYGDGVGVSHG